MEKTAAIIGRFQPLHKGHVHAVKKAMEKFEKVVIVVGSTNEKNTFRNPFSFKERKEMIRRVFGKKIKIVGIPDMPENGQWVKELLKKVKFDVAVSGSPRTQKCFKGLKKVLKPDFLRPKIYKGTRIREKMARGEKWEHLVPKEVVGYLKKIKAEERLKKLIQSRSGFLLLNR